MKPSEKIKKIYHDKKCDYRNHESWECKEFPHSVELESILEVLDQLISES